MDKTNEFIIENIGLYLKNNNILSFEFMDVVSFVNYIKNVHSICSKNISVLIGATYYILRLAKINSGLVIDENSIEILFLVGYVLSLKFNEDVVMTNKTIANYGLVSLYELNYLERLFLKKIDYNLNISANEYNKMLFILTTIK